MANPRVIRSVGQLSIVHVYGFGGRVIQKITHDGKTAHVNLTPQQAREIALSLEREADAAERQQDLIDGRRG